MDDPQKNDIFDCGVCMERYNLDGKRPKVLSCGHTNCLMCLNGQVLRGNFQCPQCRQVFSGDVKSLPDNFLLCPYLDRGDDSPMPLRFYCTDCQCEANDICMTKHSIRNMTSVVLEQVQEAKNSAKKQFKKEDDLLKEFMKMLQSTKDSVGKTLLTRIQKEIDEFQNRAAEVQKVAKVIDEVPGTAFQDSSGVSGIVDDFLFENSLRLFFFEEQKRMLEVAKKCTLTLTSDDSQVSWDFRVAVSKSSAPEEKVLSYLLYVLLVNQSQRSDQDVHQPATAQPLPSGSGAAAPALSAAPSAPPAGPSGADRRGKAGPWLRTSWSATPWPESSNAARLDDLVDKLKRCVVEGASSLNGDGDDSDSDISSVASESPSIPEQFRSSKRIYVSGLPLSATADEVKAIFSKCGKIIYIIFPDNKKKKRGSQFKCALVCVPDSATLENVLRNRPFAYQKKGEWNRVPLKVVEDRTKGRKHGARAARWQKKQAEKGITVNAGDSKIQGVDDGCKIYLGNVPLSVTEQQLRAFFAVFGNVVFVNIRPHGAGKKNFGYAFVGFSNKEAAQRVLKARPTIFYTHPDYPQGLDLQANEFNRGTSVKGKKPTAVGSNGAASSAAQPQMQGAFSTSQAQATIASLQMQANAASLQAAAAVAAFSQAQVQAPTGLYPSLGNIPSGPSPLCQGKATQQMDTAKNKQPQRPQQGGNNKPTATRGMSYDDVVRSSGARTQQQSSKSQPSQRKQHGKAEDSCSVM